MFSVLGKFNKLLNAKQKSRLAILGLVTVIGAFLEVIGVSLMLPLITCNYIRLHNSSNKR